MDDGAVGFGGAVTDILFALDDTDVRLVSGSFSCDCTADDSGTDNCYIIHNTFSFSLKYKKSKANKNDPIVSALTLLMSLGNSYELHYIITRNEQDARPD